MPNLLLLAEMPSKIFFSYFIITFFHFAKIQKKIFCGQILKKTFILFTTAPFSHKGSAPSVNWQSSTGGARKPSPKLRHFLYISSTVLRLFYAFY
jgi:hypothetical protein